jgi:precorrin-2/cobalt-factor-2 C20-methyltransferase
MLIGVGLGPGDPKLLTLKAIEVFKKSDKVYVPGKLAKDLVKPYADAQILHFPMIHDKERLEEIWLENAKKVAEDAKDGLVSFGSIGDPNFFSTFIHLKRKIEALYPEIEIETIPGVSSITAFAFKANLSIDYPFEVRDEPGSDIVGKIILKAKNPAEIAESLKKESYSDFILLERIYSEEEYITTKIPKKSDYMSILFAKKR